MYHSPNTREPEALSRKHYRTGSRKQTRIDSGMQRFRENKLAQTQQKTNTNSPPECRRRRSPGEASGSSRSRCLRHPRTPPARRGSPSSCLELRPRLPQPGRRSSLAGPGGLCWAPRRPREPISPGSLGHQEPREQHSKDQR